MCFGGMGENVNAAAVASVLNVTTLSRAWRVDSIHLQTVERFAVGVTTACMASKKMPVAPRNGSLA